MKRSLNVETGSGLSVSSPSYWAAAIGVATGLILFFVGIYLVFIGASAGPLSISIVVVGMAEIAASYLTLRAMRIAWAFAVSINGTACVVTLFAAPRIRDVADLGLGVAMIPCLIFGAIIVMYSVGRDEFSGYDSSDSVS